MHVSKQNQRNALELRALIYTYLVDNPGIKQRQICDKFQISSGTASRHVRMIRRGWRPAGSEKKS